MLLILLHLARALAAGPSDSTPADRWGFGFHPIVGYDDDALWTFGANATFYRNPDPTDPRRELDELDLVATWSTSGGHNLHAELEHPVAGDGGSVSLEAGLERSAHEDWGSPGDAAPDRPLAKYDLVDIPLGISLQKRIWDHLYAGPSWSFRFLSEDEIEPEPGAARPPSVAASESRQSGLGFSVSHKTTNPGIYKRSGHNLSLASTWYSPSLGGDAGFEAAKASWRQYVPLPLEAVLALQAVASTTTGDVPRDYLVSLGGHRIVRGYGNDRLLGRHGLQAQAELRFPIWWRLGATAFGGAGDVCDRWRDMGGDVRFAGGVGLRLTVQERQRINVRFDYAVDEDGKRRKYIKLLEAF